MVLSEKQRAALARLGDLFDELDAETRLPGEPALRSVVAEHARDQLRESGQEAKHG